MLRSLMYIYKIYINGRVLGERFQSSKTKNGPLGPPRAQTSILGHPAALGGNFSRGCFPRSGVGEIHWCC
jgi:hypothetical protein